MAKKVADWLLVGDQTNFTDNNHVQTEIDKQPYVLRLDPQGFVDDLDEAQKKVLVLIKDTYAPFLKMILDNFGEKKDRPPTQETYDKLMYVFEIFTGGNPEEILAAFAACRKLLEICYPQYMELSAQANQKQTTQVRETDDYTRYEDQDGQVNPIENEVARDGVSLRPRRMATRRRTAKFSKNMYDNTTSSGGKRDNCRPIETITIDDDSPDEFPTTKTKFHGISNPPSGDIPGKPFISAFSPMSDEIDLIKQGQIDHHVSPSTLCENCGECFSSADNLTVHIKEVACQKKGKTPCEEVGGCVLNTSRRQSPKEKSLTEAVLPANVKTIASTLPKPKVLNCAVKTAQKNTEVKSVSREKNKRTTYKNSTSNNSTDIIDIIDLDDSPSQQENSLTNKSKRPTRQTSQVLGSDNPKIKHKENKDLDKTNISGSSNESSKTIEVPNRSSKKIKSTSAELNNIPLETMQAEFPLPFKDKSQIPYQNPIQEDLQKGAGIKSFEDLKSIKCISAMRSQTKLKHFFKCTVFDCSYTTDNDKSYLRHSKARHEYDKIYCSYCFEKFRTSRSLVIHLLKEHSKRCYQCSMCFYRAVTEPHVQIHIQHAHASEKAEIYNMSMHMPQNVVFKGEENNKVITTWPYVCAIGDCSFQTFHPEDFTKHNSSEHQSVSPFYCYYCREHFASSSRLIRHYRAHGINSFQCAYCVHGSQTREDILFHLCNSHADKDLKAYAPDIGTTKTLEITNKANSLPIAKVLSNPKKDPPCLSSSEIKQTNVKYPQEVLCLEKDFSCRMFACGQECKNFDFYLNHMKKDHNAINILCPYCSVVTINSIDFENHMMCHGPNLYACPKTKCHYHSFMKIEVLNHMESSHNLRDGVIIVRQNLNCEIASFKIEAKLFPVLNNVNPVYICPFCYHKTLDAKHMKNHIYNELIYKRFQCLLCKEKLCSRRDTKSHFSTSHPHHNVKCEVSSNPEIEYLVKSFLTPDIQQRFMEYLHTNNADSNNLLSISTGYKCEECNLCFYDIADWQHHWLYCLSKKYAPYVCNHCFKKLGDIAHLKYHTNKEHAKHKMSYTLKENDDETKKKYRKIQEGKSKFMESWLTPYLKSLLGKKLKSLKGESKYYKCGHCNFNDSFRCNVLKHISGYHLDKSSSVQKIKNNDVVPDSYDNIKNNSSKKTKVHATDNDTAITKKGDPAVELIPYICKLCDRKISKLEELEDHVQVLHISENSYPFFYFPDTNWQFSEEDEDLYGCAYCNVSLENLFHLNRHSKHFHKDVPFKVCGTLSKTPETVQCKHCDLKVLSQELLKTHSLFLHPKMPLKMPVLNREKNLKRKNCKSNVDMVPTTKMSNRNPDKYRCSSCNEAFSFFIQIIAHHTADHSNLPLKFTRDSDAKNADNGRLIMCDFCSYQAEVNLLISHLSKKHENCYVCSYCGRAFNESTKLVHHNQTDHKGKPVKLVKVDDTVPEPMGTSSIRLSGIHSKLPPTPGHSFYNSKSELTITQTSNVPVSDSPIFRRKVVLQILDIVKS